MHAQLTFRKWLHLLLSHRLPHQYSETIDIKRLQLWMMRVFQILRWNVSDRSGWISLSRKRKSKIAYLTFSQNRNIISSLQYDG